MTGYATVAASEIRRGDILVTFSGGGNTYRRKVTEVDHVSNVHGKVIIRSGDSSTVANPDHLLTIEF